MFKAKVILDSINPYNGVRLITMELTYPRFIHSEFMTHRMFSRNSASSRAIPIEKMIKMVQTNPAMPVFWGKNKKGMSADAQLDDISRCKSLWLKGRDRAVLTAKAMLDAGLHKQITNRVLEPWLWHTVICTATEWSNFFALRDHEDAQPEIAHLARLMREAQSKSIPETNEIHLPYIVDEDYSDAVDFSETDLVESLFKVSSARCARVSYLTHDGKREISKDLELFDKLVTGSGHGHWSPMEHPALAIDEMTEMDWSGNFRGWMQYRKTFKGESQ